jgi:hypothetical protein
VSAIGLGLLMAAVYIGLMVGLAVHSLSRREFS